VRKEIKKYSLNLDPFKMGSYNSSIFRNMFIFILSILIKTELQNFLDNLIFGNHQSGDKMAQEKFYLFSYYLPLKGTSSSGSV